MKKNKVRSWLKPRGYVHFTKKITREDHGFLHGFVSNPKTVAEHSFFPLIHKPIITRRYKSVSIAGKSTKAHSYIDPSSGKKKSTAKKREIFYSTHLDAYVYSYYCQEVLSPLFEAEIAKTPGLTDCVSAYRKIPVYPGATNNKNNIHFADDVFKFIKGYGECVAMTFDVSKFFDSLNQKKLKQAWCSLLDRKSLPDDHHNIFKSLTRASYVEYYAVLKEFGIKNQNKLRSNKNISFCNDANEFRKRVRTKGLIKQHPHMNDDGEYVGIPQGTPISAFLSNLYLLEFDKMMRQEIEINLGGLYRRYSDDIVIVCRPKFAKAAKKQVMNGISEKFDLTINEDKVETSTFKHEGPKLVCDIPLVYLGFEFDGQRALIKSASISKFYRQLKRAVKSQARKALHNKLALNGTEDTARIFKHDLYKSFSHLGSKGQDRNFIVYAYEAARIMKEDGIRKQLTQAWPNLNEEILKYEREYYL